MVLFWKRVPVLALTESGICCSSSLGFQLFSKEARNALLGACSSPAFVNESSIELFSYDVHWMIQLFD